MRFLEQPTRNLFFTGKGGVGKTTMACAAAVQLAERGCRVLLVSTDPASNLDEVLGARLTDQPTAVAAVPGLWAMNIDPEAAARAYRERMVGPYRGVLPDAAVASMEEQFSGSCTLEIAAFDEFARLLGDPDATQDFQHVLFDTAPTGHTLRLLTLPSAWSGFMESNTTGTSCLGPLVGLQTQRRIYRQTVAALGDRETTTLLLVTRPESSSLAEAARTSRELANLGVKNQQLIMNGVFVSSAPSDPVARALEARGQEALAVIPEEIAGLDRTTVPLQAGGLLGLAGLRALGKRAEAPVAIAAATEFQDEVASGLQGLVDEFAAAERGVVLVMGKGGVGKTTVASALAVALADRGYPVRLSTTDPAAHLTDALAADSLRGLTVSRIDPARETADYTAEVLATAGASLDADGKALLEEDLRSPCTEEIAVFRAFAKAVAEASERFVVLDTAPTGHTILLLDAALAYHREVTRQTSQMPEAVRALLPSLRDPHLTRVLIVTLPEATPVHEAARLQADLQRARIEPYAWVINQSLTPHSATDPLLRQRRHQEQPYLREVHMLAPRVALVPWQCRVPAGVAGLRELAEGCVGERTATQ